MEQITHQSTMLNNFKYRLRTGALCAHRPWHTQATYANACFMFAFWFCVCLFAFIDDLTFVFPYNVHWGEIPSISHLLFLSLTCTVCYFFLFCISAALFYCANKLKSPAKMRRRPDHLLNLLWSEGVFFIWNYSHKFWSFNHASSHVRANEFAQGRRFLV